MYIDEYKVTVKGDKWNHKTRKDIKGVTKATMESNEGMTHRKFFDLLDEIREAHDCCTIKVTVEMNQHDYE